MEFDCATQMIVISKKFEALLGFTWYDVFVGTVTVEFG
jgi:hypothetical protein